MLLGHLGDFLLGEARSHLGLELDLVVLELLDGRLHRLEVGERATEPAVGDDGHCAALSLFANDVAGLTLGGDKQDLIAACRGARDEVLRVTEKLGGLAEVDDVDAVASTVDEGAHLGIPATSLVAKVSARFEHVPDSDLFHCESPLSPPPPVHRGCRPTLGAVHNTEF